MDFPWFPHGFPMAFTQAVSRIFAEKERLAEKKAQEVRERQGYPEIPYTYSLNGEPAMELPTVS